MFKKKKNLKRDLGVVIIPILIIIIVLGFFLYKDIKALVPSNPSVDKDVDNAFTIAEYDYHLRENATEFQKMKFKELKDAINSKEQDDSLVAGLIVENFVSDLYTMTNKSGSHDVGGVYYVFSPQRIQYFYDVKHNFYEQLSQLKDKYGSENLLEVSSTTVEVNDGSGFELDGKTYPSFDITCEWSYKDGNMDTSEFVDRQYFNVYKLDSGRFEIYNQFGDANE